MTTPDTYRLLILVESQNAAEQLISLFRNAGHATRAHRITSLEDLADHLDEHEWDLLLSDDKHPDVEFSAALQRISESEHDIPAILLVNTLDSTCIASGFERGAQDIIQADREQHLLCGVDREIRNVRHRLQRLKLESELVTVTQRAEQLLADSVDAIAYVSDGMHIEANESYAEIFGYEDAEELECLPIIDLIAEKDQDHFKAFLRHYGKGDTDQADLNITALRQDESEFDAHMTLSHSSVDGEDCTQIIIHDGSSKSGGSAGQSITDPVTDLYTRHYLADQLATAAVQVANGLGPACLLYINIDNFQRLTSHFGLSGCDALIQDLAELINSLVADNDCLARYGDSSLALLLSNKSAEDALVFATQCCRTVEDHICTLNEQTAQYTVSIGISSVNTRNVAEVIDHAYCAIQLILERHDNNCAEIYVHKVEPTPQENGSVATLEEAIEQNRFRLLFQPIISLRGDSREHYEVFLRLLGENDEELLPAEFLGGATDTKLDRWVILESTKMLALHHAEGHDTRLIINLTANALVDNSLIPWIGVALKAANLPPDCIAFQFSEVDISKHLNVAKNVTQALQELNCKVALSQFGKTVDPVKTLKHVVADFVKVDGSFTLDLQDNQGDPQVLKAMVNSITENNMLSIVPFVENAGVLATLWQIGVNYIQGHYLQPPSPKMDYEFTEIA